MVLAGWAGRAPYGLSCSARSTLPHFPPLSIETRGDVAPRSADFAGHPSYHRPSELFARSASLRASACHEPDSARQLPANPLFTRRGGDRWGVVEGTGGGKWEEVVATRDGGAAAAGRTEAGHGRKTEGAPPPRGGPPAPGRPHPPQALPPPPPRRGGAIAVRAICEKFARRRTTPVRTFYGTGLPSAR